MVLRQVDDKVFQSSYHDYAKDSHDKYDVVISVAVEHDHSWNTLYIPQKDLTRIDFWDLLRVAALTHVSVVYNKKVLIYCNAGVSRSVAYSLAYLISKGYSKDEAKKIMGITYNLHPDMEKSLDLFEIRMRDKFFYKLFRYALIQMEALSSDSPVSEDRVATARKYVKDGSKVLILGCTKPEYDAFSKYYDVECIHINPLGKAGKFMMFEYNEYQDGQFDAVLAFDVLEHTYDPFIIIGEVRRVLKEGGIFYHSTPTIAQSMKIPWHVSLFSADGWKWVFEWWDFSTIEEKLDVDRITQVLKKEKYTKFDSYHHLVGIS